MTDQLWAILPEYFEHMQAILRGNSPYPVGKGQGEGASPSPMGEGRGEGLLAVTKPGPKSGSVAQISIVGRITRRGNMWADFFGGASVEGTISALRNVAADDSISTVLLNTDSPGGTVDGLPELAAEVRKLRESKHVVAMANSLAASAAYWLASQADEIVASPEALIGSIGVFTAHQDWSAMLEKAGVKTTYIHAGKFKVEANPDEPLSTEARDHLQSIVDEAYGLFVADVAKGRGVTAAQVRSDYGQGRVLTAKDAKAVGMIDRVAGYHDTIARLTGVRAESDPSSPNASVGDPDGCPPETRGHDDDQPIVGNSLAAKRLRLELLEKS